MFTVYTDGSCVGAATKRKAGYGIIISNDEFNIYQEVYGKISADKPTNQIAELVAAIYGIETVMSNFPSSQYPDEKILLYTDSAYIVNCFKDKWYYNWEQNGWVNSKKEPVANKELWERLISLTRYYNIEFVKVKGHAENAMNNRCDTLAKLGANSPSEVE